MPALAALQEGNYARVPALAASGGGEGIRTISCKYRAQLT